jgi:hypothetical protein
MPPPLKLLAAGTNSAQSQSWLDMSVRPAALDRALTLTNNKTCHCRPRRDRQPVFVATSASENWVRSSHAGARGSDGRSDNATSLASGAAFA